MSGTTCPDCGSGMYCDGRCIACAALNMREQPQQMRHTGHQYALSVSRGRAGTEAWRAAGSPAKVISVIHGGRDTYGRYHSEHRWYLAAAWRRGERIEATPEQTAAWQAWCASRPQPS